MSRTATRLLVPSLVLLLPALCLVGMLLGYRGDGHTKLTGNVVGPDHQPIVGADVLLFEVEHENYRRTMRQTNETGQFSVGLTHYPGDILLGLTVTKRGYKPWRKEFMVRDWEVFPKEIVLEPDPKVPVAEKN